MSDVVVRPIEPADHEAWVTLFAAYREFYEIEPDPRAVEQVWSWFAEASHETNGLVAVLDDRVVGFAHHRLYARPAEAGRGLFLDDLFTEAEVRGRGVARALIGRLTEIARENGCTKVRWVTAADNVVAQGLYDKIADRTEWLTYDLPV